MAPMARPLRRRGNPAAPALAAPSVAVPRIVPLTAAPRIDVDAMDEEPRRVDGFIDPFAGHGTSRDPRWYLTYQADLLDERQAVELVRGSWLANRVVSGIVEEAFRPGFCLEVAEHSKLRGPDGELAGEDVTLADEHRSATEAEWRRLGVMAAIQRGLEWERREGGAAIVLGLNDGKTKPDQPAKAKAKLEWLRVVRSRDLTPARYYTDPFAAKFGEVELWQYTPTGRNGSAGSPMLQIHESRVYVFGGRRVTDDVEPGQWPGFGDGVLMLVVAAIRRFAMSLDGMELTARRNGEQWWKVSRLAELLASDGMAEFTGRLQAMERARSQLKLRVVDGEDDFGVTAAPLTGYAEIVDVLKAECAAAAEMPQTVLFGDAPSGLGANGEGPKRDWYDRVAAWTQRHAIPPLRRITEVIMASAGGEPAEWKIEQGQLWEPDAKSESEIDDIEARTDTSLIAAGVIVASEARNRKRWRDRYQLARDIVPPDAADVPSDIRDPGAQIDPAAPGASALAVGEPVQATALNGAQVAALLGIVKSVALGEVPRESGIEAIVVAFPTVTREQATRLVGPEGFRPAAPPPAIGAPVTPPTAKPEEPAP